jgi:hypothetical protein
MTPVFTWDVADELEEKRMRSFAATFGITIAKDNSSGFSHCVKKESALLGWGRYDETLMLRVSNATEITTSFSYKYFDHLDHHRIRALFRFPGPVLDAATVFVDSIRKHRRVITCNLDWVDKHQSFRQGGERVIGVHLRRGDKVWEFDRFNEWSHGVGYVARALATLDALWTCVSVLSARRGSSATCVDFSDYFIVKMP